MKKMSSNVLQKAGTFLGKALLRRGKSASWFNIASLLTGFAAFEVYRSLSLADAEYQGEMFLYYFSKVAPVIIWSVIFCEFLGVIGAKRWKGLGIRIRETWKKAVCFWDALSSKMKMVCLCGGIGVTAVAGLALYVYFNKCDTEYYEAVIEFYGIPDGVGEPLSSEDLVGRAGYWRIDDYPRKHRMTLTYVDAYGQLELMRQYSSAYGMALFQPSARIEYCYRENKEKFHSYGQECYEQAKRHGCREPEKVTYYASNGKVLLELSGDGYERLKIDTYSSKEVPQLLSSTLLRLPDGQTMESGANYWQIENSYDSNGMPTMRRLASNVCNPYGINGERYTYDPENRIESICYLDVNGRPVCNKQGIMLITFQYDEDGRCQISYYSDENGTERTEGFYGVCCEEIKFDPKGNIIERRQKDKGNRWCCDVNGVYCYVYGYNDEGRLLSEAYRGVDELPVRNKQLDSQSVFFSLKMDGDEEIIEVTLDAKETVRLSSGASGTLGFTSSKDGYRTQESLSQNADWEKEEKNIWVEQPGLGRQNIDKANKFDDPRYDGNRLIKEQDRKRNYTLIRNTITNEYTLIEYCDENGNAIINEKGYAAQKTVYDDKKRVIEETYLGLDGKLCPIEDGYAQVRTLYRPEDDKIKSIEYIGMDEDRITNKKEGYSSVQFRYRRQGESDVVSKSYYDSMGEPVYLPGLGYAAVDYLYNKNGALIQETYRDIDDTITCRSDYAVAEILYEYADDGNVSRIWYKDADEKPTNRLDTGYAVIYQEFEAGQLVRQHYEGYRNQVLCAVVDKTTGICDTAYYYEKGFKQQEWYFDTKGHPALRSDIGCASICYDYDDNGNVSRQQYYGLDGNLVLCKDTGYAVIQFEYNEEEQYKLFRFLGVDGQPVISSKYQCAGIKTFYDEKGNEIEIQYLDFDDHLLNVSKYGFAQVRRTYDNLGKLITEAYFDAADAHAVYKGYGYAMYENLYNSDGTLKECRYYDFQEDQERLAMRTDTGYAVIRYEYDEEGNRISQAYFDTEEQPVISSKYHCAKILSKYDDYGNEIETQYLGPDGHLWNRDDYGFAKVYRVYDPRTCKLLQESYFVAKTDDEADDVTEPVVRKGYGYASFEQDYDERGNWVEARYKDIEGKLTLREDADYAMIRNVYNEWDELKAQYFYGENGERVIGTEYHCAGFLFTYDKRGLRIQTSYLGIDGNPAARSDYGCAHVRKQYDEAGRLVCESYFGADGRPVIRKDVGYASYEDTYVEGRMAERRYYGLQKELVPDKETGCAIKRWSYHTYGKEEGCFFFGVDKRPVISSKYQCAGIKTFYDEKGNETRIQYLDFDGGLMNRADYGCAEICKEYDGRGNLVKASYFDAKGQPVIRKDSGCASYENIYDEKTGRWSESRYYGTDEKLTWRKEYGYAIARLEYDTYGRAKLYTYYGIDEQPVISTYYCCAGMEYLYDEKGNRKEIRYLSADGSLMTRIDFGFAQIVQTYSDSGRLIGEAYLDPEDQPAVWKEKGYASYEEVFAENGMLLESRYYGLDGSLVLRKDMGYAIVKYEYDAYGRMTSQAFYGTDGKAIISTEHDCAMITYHYENGNMAEICYYGMDGQPINRADYGCAQIREEYDDFGSVIKESYFDAKGQPVYRKDVGYASWEKVFDSYHRCLEIRYYDIQDALMLDWETGTAVLKLDYDAYGREARYRYLDRDGQPVLNTKYLCYGMQYTYDELGNHTGIQYLDSDGGMITRKDYGCAQIKKEYDAMGQVIKESYCDKDEELVIRADSGYAVYVVTYENGKEKEKQYWDTERKPITRPDAGYAMIKYRYNEKGQCISESYYDEEGQPVISRKEKCAEYQYAYDERGNCTYIWYCGLDGRESIRKDYGAILNFMAYDEYDHMIWDAYYINGGSEYQPVIRKDVGYFAIRYTYNEQGTLERKQYLDTDRNPVMHKQNGYAECEWSYNEKGQLEYVRYWDEDQEPVNIPGGYAEIEYIYDASGNNIDWTYYDSSGNEFELK